MIDIITPAIALPKNVTAYASTRKGGVSIGPFWGANLGHHVGDDGRHVQKNRALLPHAEAITWLEQTHSDKCVNLPSQDVVADAAISRHKNNFCAVMTADCVPILLWNKTGTEVAAIHAGWKGLLDDIIGKTVQQMLSRSADIVAWIGPCIRQKHYEVPSAFAKRFSHWPTAIQSISSEHSLLDLAFVAARQLTHRGVMDVVDSNLCTYSEASLFYSHRRATHEGIGRTGRIASVIGFT